VGKPIALGINGFSGPFLAIAVTPNSKMAYVAAGGVVVPIRNATNIALKPIKMGGTGAGAIANRDHPQREDGLLRHSLRPHGDPIRLATNAALKPIRLGTGSDVIAITRTLSTPCLSCG